MELRRSWFSNTGSNWVCNVLELSYFLFPAKMLISSIWILPITAKGVGLQFRNIIACSHFSGHENLRRPFPECWVVCQSAWWVSMRAMNNARIGTTWVYNSWTIWLLGEFQLVDGFLSKNGWNALMKFWGAVFSLVWQITYFLRKVTFWNHMLCIVSHLFLEQWVVSTSTDTLSLIWKWHQSLHTEYQRTWY